MKAHTELRAVVYGRDPAAGFVAPIGGRLLPTGFVKHRSVIISAQPARRARVDAHSPGSSTTLA